MVARNRATRDNATVSMGSTGVERVSLRTRRPAVLAATALWAIAVPWAAAASGFELGVSTRLEVIDHVIPGLLALAGAAVLAGRSGRSPEAVAGVVAAAVALLAGVWITTTHVSLLGDAGDGAVSWGAALLHCSAGPPVALLGLWLLLRPPAP